MISSISAQYVHPPDSESPFTIVGHLDLYCDKQAQRNLIQSVLSIGSVVGLLVANIVSDNKGRKTALILTQLTAILGTGRIFTFMQSIYLDQNSN